MTHLSIVLASLLAGGFGVPLPNVVVLVYAGSLLAVMQSGLPGGAAMVCGGVACLMAGDILWFFVGRRTGPGIMRIVCRLSMSRDTCIRNTAELFARNGVNLLLVSRFVPGLSLVTSPLAGASGVSLRRFALYDASGAAIWITACLLVGFVMSDQISVALRVLRDIGIDLVEAAVALTVALTVAYLGFKWVRRRQLIRQLRMARISVGDLVELISTGGAPFIIDVRSGPQRDADPFVIPGARLLDFAGVEATLRGVAKTQPIIAYCACPNDAGAALVSLRLHKLGLRNVRPLAGGIDAWRIAGLPVDPIG
jgi:membrane protein DedA with SNARE-associated domain/rhodanese-related sulfurtransferase